MNKRPIHKINRRILVIDDNPSIHEDFCKILAPAESPRATLKLTESLLFGVPETTNIQASFEVSCASQGQIAVTMIMEARNEGRPYALAFVDMQMPPGWDGARTMQEILQVDPEIQIVVCTAHADHPWPHLFKSLGDRCLNILAKPFDTQDVLRLANKLTEKWSTIRRLANASLNA